MIFVYISLCLPHFDDDFSLMHVAVVDLQLPFKCVFGFIQFSTSDNTFRVL